MINTSFYNKYKLEIVKLIIFTISFTVLIFFIKNYFFHTDTQNTEEDYIEYTSQKEDITPPASLSTQPVFTEGEDKKNPNILTTNKKNQIQEHYKKQSLDNSIIFSYIPSDYNIDAKDISNMIGFILKSEIFREKIDNSIDPKGINIELYKDLIDTRGKMKNKTVKLFGLSSMNIDEITSVFVHEFSHYIDIYYLQRQVFDDVSIYFYDISWQGTKTIIPGQRQTDFVSGYAMTNKYEDFAESFTYFVLHNRQFLEKTKKSIFLQEKYDYFSKYLFRKKEFQNTDFSSYEKIENYYWDITKLKINIKNFLQYLENGI